MSDLTIQTDVEKEQLDIVSDLIEQSTEPFTEIEAAETKSLMERIGNAKVVLLGEASHGTAPIRPSSLRELP